jgi:hypothetical protein
MSDKVTVAAIVERTRLKLLGPGCQGCAELQAIVEQQAEQIVRLTRAVQRDADQYERRAVHDARSYIDRHDAGFLDRSRERRK